MAGIVNLLKWTLGIINIEFPTFTLLRMLPGNILIGLPN